LTLADLLTVFSALASTVGQISGELPKSAALEIPANIAGSLN